MMMPPAKQMPRLSLQLALALIRVHIAIAVATATAANMTAPWPMYGRGAAHGRDMPEAAALQTNASGWVHRTAGWVYGAPCVGTDETVYFSSWDGRLYAAHSDGRPVICTLTACTRQSSSAPPSP